MAPAAAMRAVLGDITNLDVDDIEEVVEPPSKKIRSAALHH